MSTKGADSDYSTEVATQRREAALKKMLATPPAPFTKKKASPEKGKGKKRGT